MLRPGSPVVLVLGPFGYLVGCKDVGYGEDAGVSCADCGRVPSADIGFERFRSSERFHDFGFWGGTEWRNHKGLPPGHWVYVYPHWYIWRDCTQKP